MNLQLQALAAATVPISIYLYLIWKADRYEREPVTSYLGHIVWGASGGIAISLAISTFYQSAAVTITDNVDMINYLESVMFAPVYEEFAKASFLVWSASRKKFDNMTDGLVYGAAIGLGFAMTENYMYFIRYHSSFSEWISLVLVRSLFSGVMHGLATGIIGGVIGATKFRSTFSKAILIPSGVISAFIVHAMWNFMVLGNAGPGKYFLIMTLVVLFILSFYLSIRNEKNIILSELNEEVSAGLLNEGIPEIISSGKRDKKGWIEEEKRKDFVELTTRLAFRKKQYKALTGEQAKEYFDEIQNIRQEIKHLTTDHHKEPFNVV